MRFRLANSIRKTLLGLSTGAGLLLLVGCEGTIHTYGTVGLYAYDYYPDWDVYYYPHSHDYFWYDGGGWRSGRRVPDRFRLGRSPRVRLQLHTAQPWTEYHSVHPEFRGHYRGHW